MESMYPHLRVLPYQMLLGEGPVWLPTEQRLYWLDIEGERLHRLDPERNFHEDFPLSGKTGCLVPCSNGNFLLASPRGIEEVRLESERQPSVLQKLAHPEADRPSNRYNDGKCSPEGRFWFGSLNKERQPGQASLYVLDDQGCKTVLTGATNSNGLGWSPKGTTFYWIDTPTRRVEAFDYSPENGTLSHRKSVVSFPEDPAWGRPDGMTVDSEGMIWIAHWLGKRITRWNPDSGRLLETVSIPVSRVTSLTFGGRNLDSLFITTARYGMSPEEREQEPTAGNLFEYRPGVTGLPVHAFRF